MSLPDELDAMAREMRDEAVRSLSTAAEHRSYSAARDTHLARAQEWRDREALLARAARWIRWQVAAKYEWSS